MQIPRLELPSGNGNHVDFMDPDDMLGRDYRRLRSTMAQATVGVVMNEMLVVAAEIMVAGWQVDYLGGSPALPRQQPALLDSLKIGDTRAIDAVLMPVMRQYILSLEPIERDGDPTPPASE